MAPAKKRSRSKSSRAKKASRPKKKAPRTARKRAPARKKGRKAVARRKPAPKKSPARKKSAAAKTSQRAATPRLARLAQKIIHLTQGPSFGAAEIRELYNADASSIEASGAVAKGHAELEVKMKGWEQMTAGMESHPRHVWTGPYTICIEWDSTVTMRDGRTVQLREVAVHEIKNGKIQNERYYYDPMALAPPAEPGGLPPSA
jgi:ketosteroid isomerase-like protein